MIILDTDHMTVLQQPESQPAQVLAARLAASPDRDILSTAVTLEEQMRGWLALLNRYRDVRQQSEYYDNLTEMLRFYNDWKLLGFDQAVAPWFVRVFVAPFFKKRFIKQSMYSGFQFTKQMEPYRPDDKATAIAALDELEKQYSRLSREAPGVPHPFLGPLTHEEWMGVNLRHAELHLSFLIPEGS